MAAKFLKSIATVFIVQLIAACVLQNADEKQKNTQMNVPVLPPTSGFDTAINGQQVGLYYIQNSKGLKAAITNYGARVVGIIFWCCCWSIWQSNCKRSFYLEWPNLSARYQ